MARRGPHELLRDPRWVLLVLRAYLAFAFLWAGLSKLGGRGFLDPSAPGSMYATLVAVRASSPIGGLLGPVEAHSFAFGVVMAVAETAVGIGMLLGLFTRVAAVGGMVVSLSLFLTVSWSATPWYTGADIVYVFAFTPLLLGGAGPLSVDAWLADRGVRPDRDDTVLGRGATRRVVAGGLGAGLGVLAVAAATGVRAVRGSAPAATLAGKRPPGTPTTRQSGSGSPPSRATSPASSTSSSPSSAGPAIVAAARVPTGGAVPARDPQTGAPMYVLQLQAGHYTGLDARCPHQGCSVQFESASAGFVCPCHASRFTASGALVQGPATTGLTPIPVARSGSEIVRA